MNKINLNSVNTLVRIDKNLSFNYNYFKKYSSDDGKLIFLILTYLAKERQYDLFGFGKLDPVKFCDELGLPKEHIIWRKHENPKQLIGISKKELISAGKPVFDTVFENALYCLMVDNYQFSFDNSFLIKEGIFKKSTKLVAIQFIKSLDIIEENNKIKGGKKKYYKYELSQDFISNLSNLFFNVNLKNLANSFNNSYEGLYLKLCNVLNELASKPLYCKEIDFTEIKELLSIKSDRADYIKQKIVKAFNYLLQQDDLKDKIIIEWFKKENHNYKYGVLVKYLGETRDIQKINETKQIIWRDIEKQELRIALLNQFKNRYIEYYHIPVEEIKVKYREWLKNPAKDIDSKSVAYINTFKKFRNNDQRLDPDFFKERFLQNLPNDYAEYL